LSAVYGGALHPTAEGHAAMADAASAAARQVLQLPPPDFQNP
jgi:nicotinic acid mononucleotide adenylyltransferase